MARQYGPTRGNVPSRLLLRALAEHPEELRDYSGGLNLRDPLAALTANEFPYGYNVTLNQRGQPAKRLGTSLYNTLDGWGFTVKDVRYLYFSNALNKTFMHADGPATGTLKSATGSGAWTSIQTGLSKTGAAFVDFKGVLVYVDDTIGVATWDGAAWTVRAAGVKGHCIAVWQNKVWVAGDPANPTRVWFSNIGDATTWTIATDFVDVREGGDDPITALAASAGMDVLGRAGLLVFKPRATHRINNSTTGSYTTLSLEAGSLSNRSVCAIGSKTGHMDAHGVWITGENAAAPVKVSGKLDPLFGYLGGYWGRTGGSPGQYPAGAWRDRMLFTLETDTDYVLLEYHPDQGWLVPHQIPAKANFTFGGGIMLDDRSTVFGSTDGVPLVMGMWNTSNAGTIRLFDPAQPKDVTGAALASTAHVDSLLRTRLLIPDAAQKAAMVRARLLGRGQITVATVIDGNQTAGAARALTIDPTSKWFGYGDFKRGGYARELQFEIKGASADDTVYTPPVRTNLMGASAVEGGWALHALIAEFVSAGVN